MIFRTLLRFFRTLPHVFFKNAIFDTVVSTAICRRGIDIFIGVFGKYLAKASLYTIPFRILEKNQSLVDIQTSIQKLLSLPHTPLFYPIIFYHIAAYGIDTYTTLLNLIVKIGS